MQGKQETHKPSHHEIAQRCVRGVGSARWPDCPSNREVAHGFGLIPASVAEECVQVGGGVEQKEERLGVPRSDMACG